LLITQFSRYPFKKDIYEFLLLIYRLFEQSDGSPEPSPLFTISVFLWLYAYIRAYSLEILMEGHNWFLNQFVEIPRRSIMVCFLSLTAKELVQISQHFISAVHDHRLGILYIFLVFCAACVSYGMKQNMFFSTLSLSVLSAGLLSSGYKRKRKVIFPMLWIRIGTCTDPGLFMMTKI
jgi:hypothetical protein